MAAAKPAAMRAGFNLNLAYFIGFKFNIPAVVFVSSLSGEEKAPNVPLANTAPITIGNELPATTAIDTPTGIRIPHVPQEEPMK